MIKFRNILVFYRKKLPTFDLKLKGGGPLQGEKNFLWDSLTTELTKFIEYLDIMEEKKDVVVKDLHKCVIDNESLLKRPLMRD